ncbi:MAG: riboflavin synthase [Thermodesulfobacteriota bacterium]
MFTGIVECVGTVKAVKAGSADSVFTISPAAIELSGVSAGESISVSGVCLTVTSITSDSFTVDASHETLARTTLSSLKNGSRVNLEMALQAGGRMGGHIVNGHVDGVGTVESTAKKGESVVVWIRVPEQLSRYIVEKGSVAVDGVSLTVNEVRGAKFSVNLIPYTLDATTFASMRAGDRVNIECDIIGKYVEKFIVDIAKGSDIADLLKRL